MSDHSYNAPTQKSAFLGLLRWRIVVPLLLLTVLILAPFIYRVSRVWGLPDIGDPFDVEKFGTVILNSKDNALADYESAAFDLLIPLEDYADLKLDDELREAFESGWSVIPDEIRQWVIANHPAMHQWKIGTEKSDFLLRQPVEMNFYSRLDLIQELRVFPKLAFLEATRLLSEGKTEEAWRWCRVSMLCSRHVAQHACAMQRLVGAEMFRHASNSIWVLAQSTDITESQLAEYISQIREIYAKTAPPSITVKCEYFSLKNSLHYADSAYFSDARLRDIRPLNSIMLFVANEPQASQLVWQQYVANLLDQIDLPLKDRQLRVGVFRLFDHDPHKSYPREQLTPLMIDDCISKTSFAHKLIPDFKILEIVIQREQTRHRALELCLALRIHHKRTGFYPEDIDELVTLGILDEIPVDPFSTMGDKMKYKCEGDLVTVWSIGENGVNDGGIIERLGKDYPDDGLSLGKNTEEELKTEEQE